MKNLIKKIEDSKQKEQIELKVLEENALKYQEMLANRKQMEKQEVEKLLQKQRDNEKLKDEYKEKALNIVKRRVEDVEPKKGKKPKRQTPKEEEKYEEEEAQSYSDDQEKRRKKGKGHRKDQSPNDERSKSEDDEYLYPNQDLASDEEKNKKKLKKKQKKLKKQRDGSMEESIEEANLPLNSEFN